MAFSTLLAPAAFAGKVVKDAACFCEIGNEPENQQPFFKMGCKIWLSRQNNCATQEIIPQNSDYSEKLLELNAKGIEPKKMNIGYVGHWDSSRSLIKYLDLKIVPVMNLFNISASVDNTACKAMEDLIWVRDHLNSVSIPKNSVLHVKGNQVVSVGVWDAVLGKSPNLGAVVRKYSANEADIQFPLCKHFENKPCVAFLQGQESGYCIEGDKTYPLTCVRAHKETSIPDPTVKSSEKNMFVWKRQW